MPSKKFEYKTVKVDKAYRRELKRHSRSGWRLVQILTPTVGMMGRVKYYEMIFEREVMNASKY